ncbi:MAG TPA: extracellular solute-binding protein, partial [Devosia sp.]|nr:extracellular solute-binding protein [Devosia sp.]
GEVTWYTSLIQDQAARPLAAAFSKQYPQIKVNIVAGTVGDLTSKMLEEAKSGAVYADISHGGSSLGAMLAADLIEPYSPLAAADFPAELRDADGKWTAQVVSYLVPAINTDLVSPEQEPQSYDDLLKPEWKGKIVWPKSLSQGGPVGLIGALLQQRGEKDGLEFLTQLSQQGIVNFPANNRVVLDQVILGEFPIALTTFSHHSVISANEGAPVKWLKLDPALGTVDTTYILKNAPHPNAAKVFMEYLLSDEGQSILAESGYIPANPAVKATHPELQAATGGFNAIVISPTDFIAHQAEWTAIYETLFAEK